MNIAEDLRQRLARVRAGMAARGIGGLIVYYGAQHNMLRMDQLGYLSDFHTLGPSILLVPKEGDPTLVMTPVWDEARARESVQFGTVVATDVSELARTAAGLAAKLDKPLGVVGREVMPLGFAREFAAQFNVELIDGGDVVKSVAATRTAIELERITHAAKIADEGFRVLCATARVGMREYELAAEVEAAMQSMGSEDNFGLIAAGAHNIAIRAPTERRLEAGDVILGEITPAYRGFHAQLCRTFVLGKPTPLQLEKYAMLQQALDAGFKAARPGQPSTNIAVSVNKVIGDRGYSEYCRQPYMRTRGHGLGLGGVVPYDVTEDGGPLLERNMTMVIHPNQYIPETGYMMLGDTVVIEDNGPRPLTVTERHLHWRGA